MKDRNRTRFGKAGGWQSILARFEPGRGVDSQATEVRMRAAGLQLACSAASAVPAAGGVAIGLGSATRSMVKSQRRYMVSHFLTQRLRRYIVFHAETTPDGHRQVVGVGGFPVKTWRLPLCGPRLDGRDFLVVDGW